MAQRLLVVPQIGEVVLTKRRGSNNIRLSINAAGQVRVGIPHWTPYEAGLIFVKRHKEWIREQLLTHAPRQIEDGYRIGKDHRLIMVNKPAKNGTVESRVTSTIITVITNLDPFSPAAQKKALQACERALKQEAERYLPKRVEAISRLNKLPYRSIKIRKLTSRWGSCSNRKDISLSYFLIQLPWELVDYVIMHELAHTVFHNHNRDFWDFMEKKLLNVSDLKRQIKSHKPRIEPY